VFFPVYVFSTRMYFLEPWLGQLLVTSDICLILSACSQNIN
jgi:hypothetical protein